MNLFAIIQSTLDTLNNDSELFILERARAENAELEHTKSVIVIYPEWKTDNKLSEGNELIKTRTYQIDFKTPDEFDNSDNNLSTSYNSITSVDRIESMEILADSIFSKINANNGLWPEITKKLQWKVLNPILRANNGTMSGVSIQLTVTFSGTIICNYGT